MDDKKKQVKGRIVDFNFRISQLRKICKRFFLYENAYFSKE